MRKVAIPVAILLDWFGSVGQLGIVANISLNQVIRLFLAFSA